MSFQLAHVTCYPIELAIPSKGSLRAHPFFPSNRVHNAEMRAVYDRHTGIFIAWNYQMSSGYRSARLESGDHAINLTAWRIPSHHMNILQTYSDFRVLPLAEVLWC